MSETKTLIIILGPTAVGKTSFAIEVAKHFNTEIISADSRQFYQELKIGVARPTDEELSAVKHHFVGFLPIGQQYSAGMFERDALQAANKIFLSKNVAVCVGGSMMYLEAFMKGLDELPSDKAVKKKWEQELAEKGIAHLQETILKLDPEYYNAVDLSNSHRLIRAIEVCSLTGKKYSELRKGIVQKRNFQIVQIGLTADRNHLYSRINDRVDEMMKQGLLGEVKSLIEHKDLLALNTVGYKEVFDYLEGKCSLQEAIEKIKQHTRNYAKRQLTWWRRDEDIHWLDVTSAKPSLEMIESFLKA